MFPSFFPCSADGEVRLWDLRRSRSSLTHWSLCQDGLAAFDLHDQASVFAVYVFQEVSCVIKVSYVSLQNRISLTRTIPVSVNDCPFFVCASSVPAVRPFASHIFYRPS